MRNESGVKGTVCGLPCSNTSAYVACTIDHSPIELATALRGYGRHSDADTPGDQVLRGSVLTVPGVRVSPGQRWDVNASCCLLSILSLPGNFFFFFARSLAAHFSSAVDRSHSKAKQSTALIAVAREPRFALCKAT